MNQIPVIKKNEVLSLGCWPSKADATLHFSPSPTTQRIIQHVHISVQSILPISFSDFVLENNLTCSRKSEAEELYGAELRRRKKQVEILRDIWTHAKEKRSKSLKPLLSSRSSKILKKVRKSSTRSFSKSFQTVKEDRKLKSPELLKTKPTEASKKSKEIYFDYYSHANSKGTDRRGSEEESIKTLRSKSNSKSKLKRTLNSSKSKSKSKNKYGGSKEKNLDSLNKLLRKWGQLEKKHTKEYNQITDLMEHEKKRLQKIHKIEREKLRKDIEAIRINHFT